MQNARTSPIASSRLPRGERAAALFLLLIAFTASLAAKPRLIEYGYNVHSQFGEDGIIKKIFEIIGVRSHIAIEFGAWDGFHFSNTAALWSTNRLWKAILFEGDPDRFKELQRNTAAYPNVTALNAWVGIGTHDCLEALLAQHGISQDIDLLSIDIDGNDYHIIASLHRLKPRVIICEYNPTIPVHYDVYGPYTPDNNIGQSVAALNRIAAHKGYALVALTLTNAIYVLKEDFAKFSEFETDLALLNVNDGYMTVITTYDGKYALIKNKKQVYFYGIDTPYRGALAGECIRCDTKPLALIPLAAAYKKS